MRLISVPMKLLLCHILPSASGTIAMKAEKCEGKEKKF